MNYEQQLPQGASTLLDILPELALDDSAAAGERQAMTTVQRLSDGLITVPDRIYATSKTAIENVTRKQLTSWNDAQTDASR
ncbi:hypothetical protein CH300_12330 [Rhodococcus sp. 15-1154-1]|nr:hypothetical protein [Rhodococcus sp. 15-1154-1]OZF06003.1 hypothetical protein CH300_12330 [Rhodococcus sp. 15-1154-1]